MATDTKIPPLVILGIDAGDPDFIQRWSQEGYLPTIARIMRQGCWGKTGGSELISEHGAWVSLFSGISREQHGYYYYRQLKPGTYELESITSLDIDAPPFWTCLLGKDKRVAIIDAPDSRPLPGLPGIQLSHWATHDNWNPFFFTTASEPTELLDEVSRNFGLRQVTIENYNSTFDEDRRIYNQLLDRVKKKGELCRYLVKQGAFDLVVIVFAESHAASHQFWIHSPGIQENKTELKDNELTHAIRDIYQAIDREMGLLLDELPSQCNVFLVSSVGMEDDFPTTGLIEAFCRQFGYQASPESKGFSLKPMDIVRRVIPESVRIALSRHLPREKRERLLSDQFRIGTNWSKTTAFAIPSAYTSFIRVNLRGREPEGIVEPGTEYSKLLDLIEADLNQLIDPETGEKAITRITRTIELFRCPPHSSLPDLFVEWKPGRYMSRVIHPKGEIAQRKPDFFRRSDHSQTGFVAAAGPSIRKLGALGTIDVLDLAPSFLSLVGHDIPSRMSRKVIKTMLNDG